MTTSVLDRVPLDSITAEARQVRFAESVLRLFAFLLIGFGRVLGWCWLVPVWCFLAIRTGWRDVHPPKERTRQ
jgi:hypothetical protein